MIRKVSEDHYKHPCLLLDDRLVSDIPILEEVTTDPRTGGISKSA